MSKTEKAPTSAATLTGAVENGSVCKTAQPSTRNDTTPAAERQPFRIAGLLLTGTENAVSRRDLIALTSLSDRELRRMIERERRAGALILSDNRNGYFLASDPAEAQRFARSMRHRAREILRTARAIEGATGLD